MQMPLSATINANADADATVDADAEDADAAVNSDPALLKPLSMQVHWMPLSDPAEGVPAEGHCRRGSRDCL